MLIAHSIHGFDDIFIDSSVYAEHAFNFISCRASRIDYMRDFWSAGDSNNQAQSSTSNTKKPVFIDQNGHDDNLK